MSLLENITLITRGGTPLVSYPEKTTIDRAIFSGILAALVESGKRVGLGDIDSIKLGNKFILVKNFEDIFIVLTFREEIPEARFFMEALYNSMKKYLNFYSFNEENLNDSVINALQGVIRKYFEMFDKILESFQSLLKVYATASKILGEKCFEVTRNYLRPHIDIEKNNDSIKISSINIADPETLLETVDSATKNIQRYLASML